LKTWKSSWIRYMSDIFVVKLSMIWFYWWIIEFKVHYLHKFLTGQIQYVIYRWIYNEDITMKLSICLPSCCYTW
jgi:hypothetical protein